MASLILIPVPPQGTLSPRPWLLFIFLSLCRPEACRGFSSKDAVPLLACTEFGEHTMPPEGGTLVNCTGMNPSRPCCGPSWRGDTPSSLLRAKKKRRKQYRSLRNPPYPHPQVQRWQIRKTCAIRLGQSTLNSNPCAVSSAAWRHLPGLVCLHSSPTPLPCMALLEG